MMNTEKTTKTRGANAKARYADAIYGLAIGDALGVPYEFKERGSFECTEMVRYKVHGQPAGTWSDDTSMTIATAKSLKRDEVREVIHAALEEKSDAIDEAEGAIAASPSDDREGGE